MSRSLLPILLAALLSLGGVAQAEKKVVLVPTKRDHPWATHMYRHECKVLAACLNNHEGVKAVVSPDLAWPPKDLLTGVDALVYYTRPAGSIVLSKAHRERFKKLMDDGVGYAAIHWATDAKPKVGPKYMKILGGWFNTKFSGLEITKAKLTQPSADHPICRGWEPFVLHEEYYLDLKFQDAVKPIVKAGVKGKRQTVAWAYERSGGGRSFGTTLGHFHENFKREPFRRAIVNGILWAARAKVPQGGADVQVDEEVLSLPPKPEE